MDPDPRTAIGFGQLLNPAWSWVLPSHSHAFCQACGLSSLSFASFGFTSQHCNIFPTQG